MSFCDSEQPPKSENNLRKEQGKSDRFNDDMFLPMVGGFHVSLTAHLEVPVRDIFV